METYELVLEKPTYGGDCLGRLPDGRAVFVPFALPGERVRLRLVESKRGYARADLEEVLTPSPVRIPALCPHFTVCGGCHYQHIPYETQLAYKAAILCEQLERIAGLQDVPLQPPVPSSQPWNYRNHIQFHLAPEGKLGFQSARSQQTVPITECHLPEAPLNQVWPLLDFEAIPGLERIELRLGRGEDILLTLESSDPQPIEFSVEDLSLSAVHLGPGGALVLAGSPDLIMEVAGRPFVVSAGSFFQVNTAMAEALVSHLLAHLAVPAGATFLDIYCGVGLFSAFLAPKVGRLIGIEASPSACEDYAVNLDEFDHVELYHAPAEAVLSSLDFHPHAIVVDPPRSGLGPAVLDGLLAQKAVCLAYVSCDPATLARDARRLVAGGYHLAQITPFDLFPQTYHIESVSFWMKD